eukprot:GFKZ01011973.1.p1 GENE.GFKZ01011973.1~~GFKZ01011973.1.p1  ORF type:complete len:421 (-),score=44.62 GFKZ01011973.1:1049-2311(-)
MAPSYAAVVTSALPHKAKIKLVTAPAVPDLDALAPPLDPSVLTLPQARSLCADPVRLAAHPLRVQAEALALSVGPLQDLDPRTGLLPAPPMEIASLAIAPSADTLQAFKSYESAQKALFAAAASADTPLPYHVLLPHFGRWTYMFFPADALTDIWPILARLRRKYPALNIDLRPPAATSADLKPHTAEGAIAFLSREAKAIVHPDVKTYAPLTVREALREALVATRDSLRSALTHRRRALRQAPPSQPTPTTAPTPQPTPTPTSSAAPDTSLPKMTKDPAQQPPVDVAAVPNHTEHLPPATDLSTPTVAAPPAGSVDTPRALLPPTARPRRSARQAHATAAQSRPTAAVRTLQFKRTKPVTHTSHLKTPPPPTPPSPQDTHMTVVLDGPQPPPLPHNASSSSSTPPAPSTPPPPQPPHHE